jgi:sigma-B regulation protein RsbU (phosphoserine phosphatase)
MRVNDLMCQNTGSDRFITFFWGMYDPVQRRLTTVNAGHNYPFLLRADQRMERLEKGGMILGVLPSILPYEQEEVTLDPGDVLLLFTDGVSEALSRTGEEYGEQRLEALLRTHRRARAAELVEAVHRDVLEFARGAPQSDDITMMVLRAV